MGQKKILLICVDRGTISLHFGTVMRKGGSVRKGNWNLEGEKIRQNDSRGNFYLGREEEVEEEWGIAYIQLLQGR